MLANSECKLKPEIRDVLPLEKVVLLRDHIDKMSDDAIKELPASFRSDLCLLSDEISRKFRALKH